MKGTVSFIEIKRWFSEKLDGFIKEKGEDNNWTKVLKNSPVYCRVDDGNGNTVGWYCITGLEDHGSDVTLRIEKLESGE
jgi:hypothetical protein